MMYHVAHVPAGWGGNNILYRIVDLLYFNFYCADIKNITHWCDQMISLLASTTIIVCAKNYLHRLIQKSSELITFDSVEVYSELNKRKSTSTIVIDWW